MQWPPFQGKLGQVSSPSNITAETVKNQYPQFIQNNWNAQLIDLEIIP